jgi:peptidoglycan/xylan/chitin deacetylase (PgdA/CDA1 family)
MKPPLNPIPILLYHSVGTAPARWIAPFSVTSTAFAHQLDAIVERRCTPMCISDLIDRLTSGAPLPDAPVVITFDDGFSDTAEIAAPALSERGLSATLYVTTGALRGRRPRLSHLPPAEMLRWDDLADLEQQGIEIGSHSHCHSQLDTVPRIEAREEIRRSKGELEEALDHPVRSFAYPHGHSDAAVRRLVQEAGFDSACAVNNALSSATDNRFSLSRLTVRATTTVSQVTAWLDGHAAPVAPFQERWRTRGWRCCRRARTRLRAR